ncbi:NDR1/HIN1-like protein 26 [Curcuma longa]|uniref:NDR1/HIN1-like protein 26 n=1 Tax=Curcuma longa TaxID=136217 RepID=UPI003D9E01F5
MSLLSTASPKDCSEQGLRSFFHLGKKKKKLLYCLASLLATLLSLFFLVWFILHPSKPEFYLKDASVFQLSLVAPAPAAALPRFLNSTILTTIVSRNPNARVGIYYDHLRAYAAYKGEQITGDVVLPPFYQGHQDVNVLSAALRGAGLPVAPSFGYEVERDQKTTGKMSLELRMDGRLRWKVGTWVSGAYRVDVDCVAVMLFRSTADSDSGPMGLVQASQCSANI